MKRKCVRAKTHMETNWDVEEFLKCVVIHNMLPGNAQLITDQIQISVYTELIIVLLLPPVFDHFLSLSIHPFLHLVLLSS